MSKLNRKNPFGPIVLKGVKIPPAKHGLKVISGAEFAKREIQEARRQVAAAQNNK